MGRFKYLVDSPTLIEIFKDKYHIFQEVSLRYCSPEGLANREMGEVTIPMIAFIEGGMTLSLGRITRDYLRNHRLYVVEEGIASSSSLEEEIDKFQFEEEETQGVEAIIISEVEEETDEYSCIQTLAPIVIYVEDSSDNETEKMAPKSGKSLRIKGRKMGPTPQEANKSKPPMNPPPPPPQLPADLGLKPNPELRRKRQHEALEEGEIGLLKGNKQQRMS